MSMTSLAIPSTSCERIRPDIVLYLNPTCAYPVPELLIQAVPKTSLKASTSIELLEAERDVRTKLTSPSKGQTTSLPCECRNDSRGSKGVETRFSHCETCTSVGVYTLVTSSILLAYPSLINIDLRRRREMERTICFKSIFVNSFKPPNLLSPSS